MASTSTSQEIRQAPLSPRGPCTPKQPRYAQWRFRRFRNLSPHSQLPESPRRLLFNQPKSHDKKDLSRDQRVEIRALKKYFPDLTYSKIAGLTKHSYRQIQQAFVGPVTPQKQKKSHHVETVNQEARSKLQDFVEASKENQKIPWADLRFCIPEVAHHGVDAITTAIREIGYKRIRRRTQLKFSRRTRELRISHAEWILANWPRREQ